MGILVEFGLVGRERTLVTILKVTFQFIHTRIYNDTDREWLFTLVYANPNNEMKNVLWRDLEELSSSIQEAWMLARDFNDLIDPNVKKGGSLFN